MAIESNQNQICDKNTIIIRVPYGGRDKREKEDEARNTFRFIGLSLLFWRAFLHVPVKDEIRN